MFHFEVAKKYLKNKAISWLFSFLMIVGIFVKTELITTVKFSAGTAVMLIFCEILIAVLCVIYVACIMRKEPRYTFGTLLTSITWGIIFFADSLLIRELYIRSFFSEIILFLICAFIYALLLGFMILSFCKCLCNYEVGNSMITLENIILFIKMFSVTVVFFTALCIAAFTPVNTRGGRKTLVLVPKETTQLWEKRIFIILLFFYLPFYVLTFVRLFEEMKDK